MSTVREIEFEYNQLKVCYSGQLLNGRANIFFSVDTHIKAIYITFVGKGFARWQKSSRNRNSIHLTGSKTYLDERLYLLRSSEADIIVPAGNNHYPFSIQLSNKLPTSYEGTYGYIRYITTLHIEKASRKVEPLKETFTVIRPLNLNNQNLFRMPMENRISTTFNQFCCFFCWKTPELKMFGRLPVSGYCPGQIMNLKLDVINNSDQEVFHFLVYFIKEVTYRSNDGSKKIERVLLIERKTEGCRADRNGIQSIRINIAVPSLPPTNFSTENICGFHYFYRITAITGFCQRDPVLEIPVIIGTYPILDEYYSASVNNGQSSNMSPTSFHPNAPPLVLCRSRNPSNLDINLSELPPYPDSDPPTYEEAMRLDGTTNENFIPKYPTYRRRTKYASQDL